MFQVHAMYDSRVSFGPKGKNGTKDIIGPNNKTELWKVD